MKPSIPLENNREAIRQIVAKHHALNTRFFGSALHGCDTDTSDLDLLIDTTPNTTLMDIGAIRHELKKLLGIEVDIITPNNLPDSFKDQVLKEARLV
ncbi:MAG: nucleotidyltransferase domain-containing protein [Candidatus Polarisedimenticolaceae bacterium]|nr:nucleotidyltransferase domain-containing protein [Candidatus Polarisedimenticolaceae bacterium]